ncbi:MAG: beta-lactamase [Acidimicrobiaceae bacterium]|nr:beta-lactamase [Acidimicrobiaceae bacterium]
MPQRPDAHVIEPVDRSRLVVTVSDPSKDTRRLLGALQELIDDGFPAGISLAVTGPEGPLFSAYGGSACRVGVQMPVTESTSYDLASLTKIVCTVSLFMVLAARGDCDIDDPVARWLPDFPRSDTTLEHLLTHTSGLIAHRPFFEWLEGRQAIEAAVYAEATNSVPAGQVCYSDLNFMLLGWALEASGRESLDQLFSRHVARSLGMTHTGFRPEHREDTAATELDGDQRRTPGLVWGEVHDGNAFALGGVSGHAGLFAPLSDLVLFARQLLAPDGRVFDAAALEAMSARRAGTQPDVRGIGWRLEPEEWGDWPEATIWHTGFTGTSILSSPRAGIAVVLLTNGVHPIRRLDDQAAVRVRIHRLVAEAFL